MLKKLHIEYDDFGEYLEEMDDSGELRWMIPSGKD